MDAISSRFHHKQLLINHIPTKEENILAQKLRERGIDLCQQYYDGYKTIDIYVPKAKLDIEVDGMDHFMIPHQIISDFKREYWSERAGYHTIHIPNHFIKNKSYLDKIVEALAQVIKLREEELLKIRLQRLSKSI